MGVRSFLGGVAVGAIAGGVAIALTTPKRGAELRGDIKKEYDIAKEKAEEYKDSATIKLDQYKEKISKEELSKFLHREDSNHEKELEELEKKLDDLSDFDE